MAQSCNGNKMETKGNKIKRKSKGMEKSRACKL
jgi:hypothetical protein